VRCAMSMDVGRVPDVEVANVKVSEASDHRDEAENETNAEADEVEGVHIIWCSALRFFEGRVVRGRSELMWPRDAGRGKGGLKARVSQ
jgi:hypothetical protein